MDLCCEVLDHPEQPTLTVKTTTSLRELPQFLVASYQAIVGYLGTLGREPAGPSFCMYHNLDVEHLQVEAGFAVQPGLEGWKEVQPGALPAGRWLTCMHQGPYDTVPATYEFINRWMAESNHQPSRRGDRVLPDLPGLHRARGDADPDRLPAEVEGR